MNAVYSAFGKGLNYAVSPMVLPIEGNLTGVETAIDSLPEERWRRFGSRLFGFQRHPANPVTTYPELRRVSPALRTNTDYTVLHADKAMRRWYSTPTTTIESRLF